MHSSRFYANQAFSRIIVRSWIVFMLLSASDWMSLSPSSPLLFVPARYKVFRQRLWKETWLTKFKRADRVTGVVYSLAILRQWRFVHLLASQRSGHSWTVFQPAYSLIQSILRPYSESALRLISSNKALTASVDEDLNPSPIQTSVICCSLCSVHQSLKVEVVYGAQSS